MNLSISERLYQVKRSIEDAKIKGQVTHPVCLLAVSKAKSVEVIEQLYHEGQRNFGENYIQEMSDKVNALKHLNIVWHFIGRIQSNKTQFLAQNASWVQSLDRVKIAKRLNDQRPNALPPLQICVQVNFDQENQKGGIHPSEVNDFMRSIQNLPKLKLRGIMCIPKQNPNQTKLEQFHAVQLFFRQLCKDIPELDTLSMGMSGDFEEAISAGSTMIRVGQGLFGKRT
jgi:pyridoxal phosphate enzyme (YggS family)